MKKLIFILLVLIGQVGFSQNTGSVVQKDVPHSIYSILPSGDVLIQANGNDLRLVGLDTFLLNSGLFKLQGNTDFSNIRLRNVGNPIDDGDGVNLGYLNSAIDADIEDILKQTVVQVSHGFSPGDPVYLSGGVAFAANSTDPAFFHDGYVLSVIDANTFEFGRTGKVTSPAHGYTLETYHFIDKFGNYVTSYPPIDSFYIGGIFPVNDSVFFCDRPIYINTNEIGTTSSDNGAPIIGGGGDLTILELLNSETTNIFEEGRSIPVFQIGAGLLFNEGDAVRDSSNVLVKASTLDPTRLPFAYVSSITDANTINLIEGGKLVIPGHGRTVNSRYYLQDDRSFGLTPDLENPLFTFTAIDDSTLLYRDPLVYDPGDSPITVESGGDTNYKPSTVRTSTVNASIDSLYLIDVTGGSITVNPPIPTEVGSVFTVSVYNGDAVSNPVVVDFLTASQELHGAIQVHNIASNYACIEYICIEVTPSIKWILNE